MYKLQKYEEQIVGVYKQDGALTLCIPLDPANTDYQQFKQDVADGAKIQDENGKNLTAAKTKTFMANLP